MLKSAYIILAHNNPQQLERLINKLDNGLNDLFIHIDKKTSKTPFKKIKHSSNVFFIEHRVKIYWGGWSMVEATLQCLRVVCNTHNYNYIHLLSGNDYPIVSIDAIDNFFGHADGKQFIKFERITETTPAEWKDSIERIQYYFFNDWKERNFRDPNMGRIVRVVIRRLNRIFVRRSFPNMLIPYGGSQWWSLTGDCAKFILDYCSKYPSIIRFFKYVHCPDEIFFQTILLNSKYKNKVVNNNLRYIDWGEEHASPKLLQVSDYENIINSDSLFARKFNIEKDSTILDRLDARG
jgi:hypothetical protein